MSTQSTDRSRERSANPFQLTERRQASVGNIETALERNRAFAAPLYPNDAGIAFMDNVLAGRKFLSSDHECERHMHSHTVTGFRSR